MDEKPQEIDESMDERPNLADTSLPVEIGWFLDVDEAGAIYSDPIPMSHLSKKERQSKKSPDHCPAVQLFGRNLFALLAPYDLAIDCHEKADVFEFAMNVSFSTISPSALRRLLSVRPPAEWRSRSRPVIQLACPYVFVSDEVVTIEQTAPSMHYFTPPWPGTLIPGAFPIRSWLRPLSWAFEWHDLSRPLILRSGQPWSYIRFFPDRNAMVKLSRIEQTQAISDLQKQVKGVAGYTSKTFDLMSRIEARTSIASPPRAIAR